MHCGIASHRAHCEWDLIQPENLR